MPSISSAPIRTIAPRTTRGRPLRNAPSTMRAYATSLFTRTACSIRVKTPRTRCDGSMSTGRLFARLWREHVSHYKTDIALLVPVLAAVALAAVSYAGVLKFATDAINAGNLDGVYFWAVIAVVATAVRALA